jgi:two-component system response regulator DctR
MEQCFAAKVFIVDDDEAVVESLVAILGAMGIPADGFASALDILAKADSLESGCLLIDVCMPECNGFELGDRLRAAGVRLPTIFMTSHEALASEARTPERGAFAVLEKPIREDRLMATVQEALRRDGLPPWTWAP